MNSIYHLLVTSYVPGTVLSTLSVSRDIHLAYHHMLSRLIRYRSPVHKYWGAQEIFFE